MKQRSRGRSGRSASGETTRSSASMRSNGKPVRSASARSPRGTLLRARPTKHEAGMPATAQSSPGSSAANNDTV